MAQITIDIMEAFTRVGTLTVRYSRIGKGDKTIVLLHGYGESIEIFDDLAGQLGKHCDVIALDLPGSGLSTWGDQGALSIELMAQCVSGLIAKLGVERYGIVAHSMGGYVAVALAESDGDRIDQLVMFHSSPFADSTEKRTNREREVALIRSGKKELLSTLNPERSFAEQNWRRCGDAIDEKTEQFMLTPDDALVATLKAMANRADRSEFFSRFARQKDVLLIFGAHDHYIPGDVRQAIIERLDGAKVAMLDKSGHMGFIEEPRLSAQILSDFFGLAR